MENIHKKYHGWTNRHNKLKKNYAQLSSKKRMNPKKSPIFIKLLIKSRSPLKDQILLIA